MRGRICSPMEANDPCPALAGFSLVLERSSLDRHLLSQAELSFTFSLWFLALLAKPSLMATIKAARLAHRLLLVKVPFKDERA